MAGVSGSDGSSALLGFDPCHSMGHDVTLPEWSMRSAALVLGLACTAAFVSEAVVVTVSLTVDSGAEAALR